MEKHFFSPENIGNLTSILMKQTNVKDDPEVKKKCKSLLVQQMKEVYGKYSDKRPSNMKSSEFLSALNRKSVKQSVAICEEIKNKKKQSYSSSSANPPRGGAPRATELSDFKKERDKLMFGQQHLKIPPKRPQSDASIKDTGNREMLFNDTNNMSNYAMFNVNEDEGGYIGADGSLKGGILNLEADNDNFGDRNKKDDLDRAMKERQSNYDENYRTNPNKRENTMYRDRDIGNNFTDRLPEYENRQQNMKNPNSERMPLQGYGSETSRPLQGYGSDTSRPEYTNRQHNRTNDNNFDNSNHGNNNYENFDNNYDNNYDSNFENFDNNNFGNGNFGNNYDNDDFNNNNFDNNNFGNNRPINNENNNDDIDIKAKFNDVLASRNMENNNVKPPPSKKIDPLISPYQNSQRQEHMSHNNNQQNRQNYNQQNYDSNYNQQNRRTYNQQNYNQQNHNQQNHNQQNHNQQNRPNYNPNNPKYNTNYANNTDNTYLNEMREVLSPLYNDDTVKEEMVNLDSDQLDAYITKMKNKIYAHMNVSNFDPYCLQTLSSSELKELINKISLDLSGIDNIMDNTSHSNYQIQNNINHDKKQYNTKQNNDMNEVDTKITHHNNTFEDILIKSNEYDDPENYSDYMVEFKQPYYDIKSFQLLNLKLPPITNVITNDNNNIKILLNDDEINKQIPPNMYDLENLLKVLNVFLSPYFNVVYTNNRIMVQNITNTKFDMANNDRSVFRMLGFKKLNYIDRSSYISEDEPLLGANKEIFLFIGGIKDDGPIYKFNSLENPNNLCPVIINLDSTIDTLSDIIIKFKYENDIESNKNVNFYGKPHEMLIRLGH